MAGLKRRQDWPSRLDLALDEASAKKTNFGKLDCCLFPADVIRAMTDIDLAADLRCAYKSELTAYRLMKKRFGGAIEETVERIAADNGMEEIPVAMARRGDLVFIGDQRYNAPGVVSLSGRHVALFLDALIFLPIEAARRAWRV